MFNLILDAIVFSALLLFATSLESCPPSLAFSRDQPSCLGMVSRYLIIALAAFPWITFARLRACERALQRVGTKLFLSSGLFSGKSYISEILISALVSIALVGLFVARRWAHRVWRNTGERNFDEATPFPTTKHP